MASFDVVSKTDLQEVDNAIHGVTREIDNRYDFKGGNTKLERRDEVIEIVADDDYKLTAVQDLLKVYFTRRDLDAKALDFGKPEAASGDTIKQVITIKQGLDQDTSKKIIKEMKAQKLKTQAAIRGDELRITGKKRDELQAIIALIKGLDLDLPLQFINFRD